MKNFMKEPIKKNEQIQEINKIEISLECKKKSMTPRKYIKMKNIFRIYF